MQKNFVRTSAARVALFELRRNPDALPQRQGTRPWIQEHGVLGSILFEARAFGASMEAFSGQNGNVVGHTSLCLVNPTQRGRLAILEESTSKPGGFYSIDWHEAFKLAYARSQRSFEIDGTGEQIFAVPGPGSRVVMVDDMKTAAPIFDKTLCIVLETSRGNYQHLYCFDRALNQSERLHIQRAIARRNGGDMGAISGSQPHRVPGSINYKPGRGLWVCRLAGSVMAIDGGKPLPAGKWLHEPDPVTREKFSGESATVREIHEQIHIPKKNRKRASGEVDQSAQDWHFSILQISKLKTQGVTGELLESRLMDWVVERVRPRKGADAQRYARRTVLSLKNHGHMVN